jgi:hypothetical protein
MNLQSLQVLGDQCGTQMLICDNVCIVEHIACYKVAEICHVMNYEYLIDLLFHHLVHVNGFHFQQLGSTILAVVLEEGTKKLVLTFCVSHWEHYVETKQACENRVVFWGEWGAGGNFHIVVTKKNQM